MKLLILGWLLAAAPALASKPTHIILDPGHGGKDRGATRGELFESHITLKVSKILGELLRKDDRFKVSMTRTTNRFVSLSERTEFARKKKGDIFISVHVNSSHDNRAKGAEFYFQNQLPADQESLFLAGRENGKLPKHERSFEETSHFHGYEELKTDVKSIILDLQKNNRIKQSGQLSESLLKSWRGTRKSRRHTIRQAPFFVISHVSMPSALVELGFLSNAKDAKKLTNPAYQRSLARSIYKGLINFKEVMDKGTSTDLD